jgi:hypothetical protein
MVARDKSVSGAGQANPGTIPPQNPIPAYPGAEHSWTLQTVFELQKSVGQLTQAVSTLTDQQKDLTRKVDGLSHKIYAAIAVLLLAGAVLTLFGPSINDFLIHRMEGNTTQQQTK